MELRAGRPDFLAVDEEVIPLVDGLRLEVREIRASVRLREALRPRFVAAENPRQIPLLLRVGAPGDDRRAHEIQAHRRGQDGRARRRVLLFPNHTLDQARAAAPVLLRPRDADPARRMHGLLPGAPALVRLAV